MLYDKELIAAHIRNLATAALDYVDIDNSRDTLCAMLDSIAMFAERLEDECVKEDDNHENCKNQNS